MKYYIIYLFFFYLINKIFSDNNHQYLFQKKNILENLVNYTKLFDYKIFNKTINNNKYNIEYEFNKIIIPFVLNNI